jgi:tetratricopeptide (TPR) repeat protein
MGQLCNYVVTSACAFDDVSRRVEEEAYSLCSDGRTDEAVHHLAQIVEALEAQENKNEETLRDLGDVYELLGELLQTADRHGEAIEWLQRAIVSRERDTRPYQSLARSYASLGEVDKAVRSLEQELLLSPGNYFSYLMLAELYEQRGNDRDAEQCLERLLERDPENVLALHALIRHHESRHPGLDVAFLCRRLVSVERPLVRKELVVWTFHMCREGRLEQCEAVLRNRAEEKDVDPIVFVLAAHVCGCQEKSQAKRTYLDRFIEATHGREDGMRAKVREFVSVFGSKAATALGKKVRELSQSPPTAR